MNDNTITLGVRCDCYFEQRNTEDGPITVQVEYFIVAAQSAKGERWGHVGPDLASHEAAEAVRAALVAANNDPATNPGEWMPLDPAYGSEAWGPENEYDLACFEADCYGEPRPNWR